MGSPALTSRGFVDADFDQVADFVHRAIKITGGCFCFVFLGAAGGGRGAG
jgi:hypothetical protein